MAAGLTLPVTDYTVNVKIDVKAEPAAHMA
jgi:hypothetical protein